MNSVEVAGLGSCTVDFFALVPQLIGAEEKINATRLEIHAGGVTANNLTQVARLGARAGDAFMGGLSFALLQGWSQERVACFANACAALCCTQVGARAMANREAVEELVNSDA